MHIHPPKPLHGWKEFLNEIFVIVVGVLIALGLEAVVEELHWQHKVHDGEERLKDEMALNYKTALYMVASGPCMHAQLDGLADRVMRSGSVLDPAPLLPPDARMTAIGVGGTVLGIRYRTMSTSVWQGLNADGTVQHMPKALQKRLAFVERQNELYMTPIASQPLQLLARPIPLDPAVKVMLMTSIENSRLRATNMTLAALQIAGGVRDLGYAPSPEEVEETMKLDVGGNLRFCREHKLPIGDWRAALARAPKLEQYGV